jgi:tRNA-modifying protein YgfZ
MNSETGAVDALARWHAWLRQQGARIENGEVRHFGDAAAERRAGREGDVLLDLSPLSLIRVAGADAHTFLNAQLTNDVTPLDTGQSQIAAWCSPKGRMLALLRVIRRSDDYLLQLPMTLRDDVLKRLRVYVMRSKVTLESVDVDWVRLGVSGPNAETLVRQMADRLPSIAGRLVLRLPGLHPRFEILTTPAEAPAAWNALKHGATPAGYGVWQWHDIMAGIPSVSPSTSDAFVPQMANLDLIGGISFSKGCYPGQEIVARVHYRGRIKERMFRAHLAGTTVPNAGEPIYSPALPSQSAGTVVSAQPSPEGGSDLLAVIQLSGVQAGALHFGEPQGPRITLEPLPYLIPMPDAPP